MKLLPYLFSINLKDSVYIMLNRNAQLLILAFLCLFATSAAAADRSIHVEWGGYTPPSELTVSGFRLYQDGSLACEIQNPNATSMDCAVSLYQDTTPFTLTATFTDGSESPHSAPFPLNFTQETPPPTPPDTSVSHAFTFIWEDYVSPESISGYRFYVDETLLCATSNPYATTITCNTELTDSMMNFSMSAVGNSGLESERSNILQFDPTAYAELFTSEQLSFSWSFSGPSGYSGFRIYQNDELLCETSNPEVRELTCTTDPAGTVVTIDQNNDIDSTSSIGSASDFGITVVYYGTEYTLSDTLTYTTANAPVITELSAAITANKTTGTAPLTVGFDASASSGDASAYHWSFGDGDTATASNINHTFSQPGTYTTKLTIADSQGNTSNDTVTITVAEGTTANKAPTAAISSSAVTGEAPAAINFNASGSTDPDGTISSYAWNFGDGSSATGKYASHTFASAGTFAVSLVVTDNQGTTNATNIPIIITEQSDTANQAPQAKISVTNASGGAPLTVTLSAANSTDSDGTIETYTWNFGDGTSATGVSTSHTYTAEATYTATLEVTDDKGKTAVASTTITVEPASAPQPFTMEIGEVDVNSSWKYVKLEQSFHDPIIIAGPPTYNGTDPGVIRLRNIDASGFEIKFAEWDYCNGTHDIETVSYMVIEKGHYDLGGYHIEAGTFSGATSWKTTSFQETFPSTPVVLTTVASMNESSTISGRIGEGSASGFNYYFREQEANTNTHANERINYIAFQKGYIATSTISLEVAFTADTVTHEWKRVNYQKATTSMPFVFAEMQTTDGADTSALRVQDTTTSSYTVKVEEERSNDSEVYHTKEVIGYLIFAEK